jgi:hypothetical protein
VVAAGRGASGSEGDVEFDEALGGGQLAEMLSVAGRRVLDAIAQPQHEDVVALLRDVLPADPPESYDPSPYIEAQTWVFAKTMPQNPHEYVVLRRSTDWREHLRFLRWIRVWGDRELFKGTYYLYRTVGEWRYWALGPNDTIINRRREP